MKITKVFYVRLAMNIIKSKDHNIGLHRTKKVSFSSCNNKKYIKNKIDVVSCHIFVNILVNHIKIVLLNIDNLF